MTYLRPRTLEDAFAALDCGARIVAGATDAYPGQGAGLAGDVVDISGLDGLRGISLQPEGLVIGAAVTWTDLAQAPLPPACAALQQAARQVGGRQVQNAGTIGGNLCNASPAADGVPPLLVLDAEVRLQSSGAVRQVPLAAFLQGPRWVDLRPGEVMTSVHLPASALQGVSSFGKLGARAYLVISIAMVAVRLTADAGRIVKAAVAVGACGPVSRRLPSVEQALLGPVAGAPDRAKAADYAALAPIDDVRATAIYRRHAAAELVARAVGACT